MNGVAMHHRYNVTDPPVAETGVCGESIEKPLRGNRVPECKRRHNTAGSCCAAEKRRQCLRGLGSLLVVGVATFAGYLLLPFDHCTQSWSAPYSRSCSTVGCESATYDAASAVKGLNYCPDLEDLVPLMLDNKRRLLRMALDAMSDSSSSSPLLLTESLIKESADLLYTRLPSDIHGSRGTICRNFNHWADSFYRDKLARARPVVVYVSGKDVCNLWNELDPGKSPPAGSRRLGARSPTLTAAAKNGSRVTPKETEQQAFSTGPGENAPATVAAETAAAIAQGSTPIALMTAGWDDQGAPFGQPEWGECASKILALPQVVRWFASHSNGDPLPSPKVEFIALGFGGPFPRSKLKQSLYLSTSEKKLQALELCEANEKMEMLFMCSGEFYMTPRAEVNEALFGKLEGQKEADLKAPRIIPDNHFPSKPADTLAASVDGLFAISPPGTRPDCFRHYEMLLAGNVVYVPDDPSLRSVLAGLPVIFVQGGTAGWGEITCESMAEHTKAIAKRLDLGLTPSGDQPFNFAKLTVPYWSRFIRDRVWQAQREIRQAGANGDINSVKNFASGGGDTGFGGSTEAFPAADGGGLYPLHLEMTVGTPAR